MKAPSSGQSQNHKQQMQEKACKSRKRKRTKYALFWQGSNSSSSYYKCHAHSYY